MLHSPFTENTTFGPSVEQRRRTLRRLEADDSGTNLLNEAGTPNSVGAAAPPPLIAHLAADAVFGTGTLRRLQRSGAGVQSIVRRTGFCSTVASSLVSSTARIEDDFLEASVVVGVRKVNPAGRLVGSTPPVA